MTTAPNAGPPIAPALVEAAWGARAWPFEEARKLLTRLGIAGIGKAPKTQKSVIFETGYGPSGLPHIGTFGEVARTTMVRNAFRLMTADTVPTRLICFSDDMDGMRKIPENVPDRAALEPFLQKPLTAVPNPFGGDYESFGHHNNAMLRRFLDGFGFDYEFMSATEEYKAGRFDETLLKALHRYDEIMAVMIPTLGEERQQTYSPFLPISPSSGRVLYVPMKQIDAGKGTITFTDEDGTDVTMPVTGGRTKLQWKPDFGMRWAALGVDFEMFGKDHQTNAPVYDRICEVLGARAPEHYVYELFLDENGQKISKSKGNGITIDEWLTYATPESLALFMFQKPRAAKRLHFDVIPRAVDEYLTFLEKVPNEAPAAQLENPAWHIHAGHPPEVKVPISFGLLLNLVSASNAGDKETLWGFIRRHAPGASPETDPALDKLAGYAVRYFNDFDKPKRTFRLATPEERVAMQALDVALAAAPANASGKELQDIVYEIGKTHGYADKLRDWFKAIYEVLIGQSQGPRFGSFIELYGVPETRALIAKGLAGELAPDDARPHSR